MGPHQERSPAMHGAAMPAIRDLDWPAWLPLSMAGLAAASAYAGALQRDGVLPLVLATAAVAPLLWDCFSGRPLHRLLMAGLVLAGAVPLLLVDPPVNDLGAFVLVVVAMVAGATMPLRQGLPVLLATVACVIGVELARAYEDAGAAVWVFGVVAGYLGAQAVQKTLLLLEESRAREQESAQRHGSEERERIAREVHDVVAHSLSVTLLHVTGARRALEAGDVAEASEALQDAEALGRAAMTDIRSVVGLLRASGEDERHAPRGGGDVAELLRSYTDAGLDVRWEAEVDPAAVPPTVGLALYRLLQESLSNAAKHAPRETVRVRLDGDDGALRLTVRNPVGSARRQAGIGLGLVGMRERVRLLGGSLHAGASGDEWTVEASLPLSAGQTR